MGTKQAHTPTLPVKLLADDRIGDYMVDAEGDTVDFNTDGPFIVKAVNCHEGLLRAFMRYGSHDNSCMCANPTTDEKNECSCGLWKAQVIAKAEGK